MPQYIKTVLNRCLPLVQLQVQQQVDLRLSPSWKFNHLACLLPLHFTFSAEHAKKDKFDSMIRIHHCLTKQSRNWLTYFRDAG